MSSLQEIDALQRFVYQAAGLRSMRLAAAPPTVARPVILWEQPQRGRNRNLNRYTYVVQVRQFGKLFVENYDQAAELQDSLLYDLEEKYGVLDVYEGSQVVARLKAVEIEFSSSENLDIPFSITYQATYGRTRPEAVPAATYVGNKITTDVIAKRDPRLDGYFELDGAIKYDGGLKNGR